MKIMLTLIAIMFTYSSLILGQGYAYGYDEAGNRIIRYSVLSQLEDNTEIEETAEIADRNTQEDTHEIIASSLIPTKPIAQQKFGATQMTWHL